MLLRSPSPSSLPELSFSSAAPLALLSRSREKSKKSGGILPLTESKATRSDDAHSQAASSEIASSLAAKIKSFPWTRSSPLDRRPAPITSAGLSLSLISVSSSQIPINRSFSSSLPPAQAIVSLAAPPMAVTSGKLVYKLFLARHCQQTWQSNTTNLCVPFGLGTPRTCPLPGLKLIWTVVQGTSAISSHEKVDFLKLQNGSDIRRIAVAGVENELGG